MWMHRRQINTKDKTVCVCACISHFPASLCFLSVVFSFKKKHICELKQLWVEGERIQTEERGGGRRGMSSWTEHTHPHRKNFTARRRRSGAAA
jgi:hypothetical protein